MKGILELKSLGELKPGKKLGTIQRLSLIGVAGQGRVLEEKNVLTFYADKDRSHFDVDETFTAKTDAEFADTKEGFLPFA